MALRWWRRASAALLLLVLSCGNLSTVDSTPEEDKSQARARLLQERKCGNTIATVTPEEVVMSGREFLTQFVDSSLLNDTVRVLFLPVVNSFQVMIICGSCLDLAFYYKSLGKAFPLSHQEYCNQTLDGAESIQSSLVFLPNDPKTGKLPDRVGLRVFVSLLPTNGAEDSPSIPSARWTPSMLSLLQQANITRGVFQQFMVNYLPAMVAAGSGTIALIPDLLPYGPASTCKLNPSIFNPIAYRQPTMVTYLELDRHLSNITNQCTVLDDRVTIYGVADGGYAGQLVADSFRPFGIRTLTMFSSAAPLDVESFLLQTLQKFMAGQVSEGSILRLLLPALANTFTTAIPGQPMLSANYTISSNTSNTSFDISNNVPGWYKCPDQLESKSILLLLPKSVPDILDQGFVQAFMAAAASTNGTAPCQQLIASNSAYSTLCKAIVDVSVWPSLLNLEQQGKILHNPVSLCFSTDDEVVNASQYPADLFRNELITQYLGPTGYPALVPHGSHTSVLQYCVLDPILFYSLEGHVPAKVEDRSNHQRNLTANETLICARQHGSSGENPGDGNPGDGNPGDGNPGNGNPGDGNPGNGNQGDGNQGDGNQGNGNGNTAGTGSNGGGAGGSGGNGSSANGGVRGGSNSGAHLFLIASFAAILTGAVS